MACQGFHTMGLDGYGSSGTGARFNRAADRLTGADAERAEGALDRPGPGITPQALTTFARQAVLKCPVLSELAIPAGFEPATHGVEIRYSIQLSYGTAWGRLYHCQYEKSAFPPSRNRTGFPGRATKAQAVDRPAARSNAMLRQNPAGAVVQGLAFDKCRMRLFCPFVPPPSVRHLLAHFSATSGASSAGPGAPS